VGTTSLRINTWNICAPIIQTSSGMYKDIFFAPAVQGIQQNRDNQLEMMDLKVQICDLKVDICKLKQEMKELKNGGSNKCSTL
jgi:hypothetical protein